MNLAPVSKAVGAGIGGAIAIPSAPELYAIIERFTGDLPMVVDIFAVALIGAAITYITTYFAPANKPA